MFKIVILQVIIVAAVTASPIYPGGMGGYGVGTSSVSVSRRTDMISPGMGMMTPGMGMGTVVSSVYGTRSMGGMMAKSVAAPETETTIEETKETISPNLSTSETVVEKDVEIPVDGTVEVMKDMDTKSPMGEMRTGVMGGMGMGSGMVGSAGSSRTDVVKAGMGGVERDSVGESHVNTPFGSKSTVSSTQQRSGVLG